MTIETIEQLSEMIMAVKAACKDIAGSGYINTDSINGPYVQLFACIPACVAAFNGIDAPLVVERCNNGRYEATKTCGGVRYLMLLDAVELGMTEPGPDDVSRYLEQRLIDARAEATA